MAHIEKEVLEKLYRGELPLEEQLEVLDHMSNCDYCASAFANVAEEMTLMTAPKNLKSSILHQAGELPVQLQAKQYILSKRMQLMLYSMKIGVAVACAILMIFTVNMNAIPKNSSTVNKKEITNITTLTDKFTQSVNSITDQFMHGEDYNHD